MNAKLQEIIFDHGIEGYGLYWYCLELVAQNVSSENLTFELKHDARIIGRNIGLPANRVEEIMKSFIANDLFSASKGRIQCLKLAQRADDFTAKAIRRKPRKNLLNQSVGVNPTKSDKVPLEEEVRRKKKEEEVRSKKEEENQLRFAEFWDLYDKKSGRPKCESKFKKLKKSEIEKIFEVLPKYITSTPDKQYRKNPLTWLNNSCWDDELQTSTQQTNKPVHHFDKQNYKSGSF